MSNRKRGLDPYAAQSDRTAIGSGPSSKKKVKFSKADPVSLTDDGDAELDFPGQSKKRNSRSARRGTIQTDGYDSDSSDEGKPAAADSATKPGQEDDDDDMFGAATGTSSANAVPPSASGSNPDRVRDAGLEPKGSAASQKEFLDLNDIEGQEISAKDMRDSEDEDDGPRGKRGKKAQSNEEETSESEEEEFEQGDEHANADDAPRSRRSKKGMGYAMSGFNMVEELKEGRLAADGTYLHSGGDPLAVHDAWLQGVSSKKEIKAARLAKEKRDAEVEAQEKADRARLPASAAQCYSILVDGGPIRPGESVMAALKRLGDAKKAAPEGRDILEQIELLTRMASLLLDTYGEADIYESTYESIIRTLRIEGEVPRGWEPKPPMTNSGDAIQPESRADKTTRKADGLVKRPAISRPSQPEPASVKQQEPQYLYRWKADSGVASDQIDKTFGPFPQSSMESWISANFFGGSDASKILVRREGAGQDWQAWQQARL
ncbi:uncharacterized protein L969DRAFT_97234 [Mixia osmundae IAM 14324]|uniref:GYF domain-containing protein n=1 Tax=Mixia osmundae (strain CBS 9802 / IAM 14324 / JCM 22182 / KY 12970) TaxID=764103 RepID=G7DWB5_MIXOS|nr:uncharacterized protein L969DRAFT_97234 [Mixia osmundae IAM 14324]KEI36497.1 hypothetical protein L969DRAFT_97234 [Mixia osmundae IAM 14324]GAA94803.1 hypothetical protein E5Q_01457 [Mixia osmundae IAM 14324]